MKMQSCWWLYLSVCFCELRWFYHRLLLVVKILQQSELTFYLCGSRNNRLGFDCECRALGHLNVCVVYCDIIPCGSMYVCVCDTYTHPLGVSVFLVNFRHEWVCSDLHWASNTDVGLLVVSDQWGLNPQTATPFTDHMNLFFCSRTHVVLVQHKDLWIICAFCR